MRDKNFLMVCQIFMEQFDIQGRKKKKLQISLYYRFYKS